MLVKSHFLLQSVQKRGFSRNRNDSPGLQKKTRFPQDCVLSLKNLGENGFFAAKLLTFLPNILVDPFLKTVFWQNTVLGLIHPELHTAVK